ncbi:hypothetical protein D9C73_009298 [Collichthys lucidus]|uniref:Uncharacterized protein n=1 Tax=Collichthys lucidus TaxID=240159 RepID=A0A4U5UK53_COLLU|nr:hypothetical protein D9C73_009298 [Collichthys lucidus]
MDCFSSADPDAMKATLLYDFNNDKDDLWYRTTQPVPSSPVSSPSGLALPVYHVLHDRTVYAMCDGLSDGVRVVMEAMVGAVGKSVDIFRSDCPTPAEGESPPLLTHLLIRLTWD